MYYYDKIMDYEALYLGGDLFRQRKENFLIKRHSDEKYPSQWKERLSRAGYINRAGGIIDWIAAAVFYDRPTYEVSDTATDETRAYWEGLNEDADGLGHPISDILTRCLVNMLVHKRSYLTAKFESERGRLVDGSLNAYIDLFNPVEIVDWQHDNGKLEWCRRDGMESMRSADKQWAMSSDVRKTWTFYDDETINTYEAIYKNGQRPEFAQLIESIAHDFGMPIFEVYSHCGQWVMDRIYDVAVALFNRDSSATKYLDDGAFQLIVLSLEEGRSMGDLFLKDIAGIRLNIGESLALTAPQSGYYQPLQSDREYLKASLFEVMQSTAINAASIPQAGRMSGETVNNMREPLKVLLASLAYPIYDAWNRITKALLEHRGEPEDSVELKGFGEFVANMEEMKEVINGSEKRGIERTDEDGGDEESEENPDD